MSSGDGTICVTNYATFNCRSSNNFRPNTYMFKYGFAGSGLGTGVVAQQGYAATIGLFLIIAVLTFFQLKLGRIGEREE